MKIRNMDEISLKNKRVFIRVDFNVPLDESGEITDDTRIRMALPTLNHAIEQGAMLILASHLGRPGGKRDERYSMKPCARMLSRILGRDVTLAPDCIGPEVEKMAAQLKGGDILMLENLRFHAGETDNDAEFAGSLAELAEVYVNNGFAVAHRKNASVDAITGYIDVCAAGFLMKQEIDAISGAMKDPRRPLVAIVGGGKVKDKLGMVEHIIDIADTIILGGALAYTFLKAGGVSVGDSRVEEEMLSAASGILEKAARKKVNVLLPVDCILAREIRADAETRRHAVDDIPDGWMGLDIGPSSLEAFADAVKKAGTVVWNGPMGVYEIEQFSHGTSELVKAVADSGAYTVLGGGDLDAAVHKSGKADAISHLSTGGGAFLKMLEGKPLPAIEALERCGQSSG